jgi:CRP/FNR family transcriptional regulator, nitrogen oxide reductase regulator
MANISEIRSSLAGLNSRFLEGLTPDERTSLLEAATIKRFQPHTVIAHEGYLADYTFLLVQGRARFFCTTPQGEKLLLRWVPPGEVCGLAALSSQPVNYVLSTETVKLTTALAWHGTTLRSLALRYPRLFDNALLLAHDYASFYRTIHISATCQTARQRLAMVLGNLASGIGHRVPDGVELDIRNEELANEANVTIFTTSRLLNEWQRKGILVKSRGKVMLRSPKDLLQCES